MSQGGRGASVFTTRPSGAPGFGKGPGPQASTESTTRKSNLKVSGLDGGLIHLLKGSGPRVGVAPTTAVARPAADDGGSDDSVQLHLGRPRSSRDVELHESISFLQQLMVEKVLECIAVRSRASTDELTSVGFLTFL
ncbi:unnamed protein product [Pleuronectes platessa]|uniref:Uncharacterized protein n=1 Tax=Pleuronectes platessa TaxID=8262 RepID=A0A9N7Y7B8_PLEPL|nr:unnamed protein product [Pleuronectes platessa]